MLGFYIDKSIYECITIAAVFYFFPLFLLETAILGCTAHSYNQVYLYIIHLKPEQAWPRRRLRICMRVIATRRSKVLQIRVMIIFSADSLQQ